LVAFRTVVVRSWQQSRARRWFYDRLKKKVTVTTARIRAGSNPAVPWLRLPGRPDAWLDTARRAREARRGRRYRATVPIGENLPCSNVRMQCGFVHAQDGRAARV
jgi:hypothetical protein